MSTIVIIYGTNICCCHFVTHSTQLNPSTTSNQHSSLKHINEQMIQPNYKRRQHNLYVELKRTTNGTYVHINATTPLVRFTSKCYSNNNNNNKGDNKGKPNEPKMTPKADTLNWYLNLFMDCLCVYAFVFFYSLFLLHDCIWFSCWYIFIIIIILVVNVWSWNCQQ